MEKLASLKDLLSFGVDKAVQVISLDNQYELAKKELAYQTAQQKAYQAQQAAEKAKDLSNSEIVKNVVFWTLTAVAGTVLGAAVLKAVGAK